MKRLILVLGCFLSTVGFSLAQSVGPSSLNAGAGGGTIGGNSFDWSAGAIAVDTFTSATFVITEGVLQPMDKTTTVKEDPYLSQHILIYPNPASQTLFLQPSFESGGKLFITMTDVSGNIGLEDQETLISGTEKQTLHTERLASGTYILRLQFIRDEKSFESCYTIEKLK